MLTQHPHIMVSQDIHIPVLSQEVIEALDLRPGQCFVDGTLGLGGHSVLAAPHLLPGGRIIGVDRDAGAIQLAKENLSFFEGDFDAVHDDFRNISRVLSGLGVDKVDGILFDLGISSYQLQDPERGFSFQREGPLDMRMDQDSFLSAYDLINSLSEHELSLILRKYGEERLSGRIARFLVDQREKKPLQSTKELCDVVLRAIPAKFRHHQKIHPATRTFQAFRIAVNRELESIELVLERSVKHLRVGAKICVISFHSLEDRIVKHRLRDFAADGLLKVLTKKPVRPQEEEIQRNPRSRSARMRVAQRV